MYPGIYNYQLSQRDPAGWTFFDRITATLIIVLYLATSTWYLKSGDRSTGLLLAIVAGLQILTVLR